MGYRNGNHMVLNVGSLPNTLNNRINIQITMTDRQEFAVKQIVWAKVADYPWWPARVVKSLAQHSRTIFRLHFFGDPTYCYLQSQRLLDFDSGLALHREDSPTQPILKKSIQLAKAAYKKNKGESLLPPHQYSCSHEGQASTGDFFEETKLQSKPLIENMEKIYAESKSETVSALQITAQATGFDNLCPDNVIQHINGEYFRSLRASKGYNNRKQVLALQLQLKDILLAKYHLRHLPKGAHEPSPLRIDRAPKTSKQKPIGKTGNRKKDLLAQSARKLSKIMARSGFALGPAARESTLRIVESISENSLNSSKRYARLYLRVVRWIKEVGSGLGEESEVETLLLQRISSGFDQGYHCAMEQEKKEDEQKSKVTQIEACSH